MAENINEIIGRAAAGSAITLPAGEFEGPVLIGKPLRLIGNGTTIWAKKNAAIEINSNGVSLENLRVELTEGSVTDTVILSRFPCTAKNVEVLGRVSGFGAADGYFDVPRTMELGEFAADEMNTFTLSVSVPEQTVIECAMRDVTFSPAVLEAGRNTITVKASGISAQTFLYTEVLFKSTFTRRIYLSGKPVSGIPAVSDKCIYTAPARTEAAPQTEQAPPTDVISLSTARQQQQPQQSGKLTLQRGQRVALSQYIGSRFSVYFTGEVPTGWEVDPYVFLLDGNNKTLDDTGLVFFGNERSPHGEAAYFPHDGHIEIDLANADFRTAKISLAYSIYAGNESKNFSCIKNPCIKIRDGEERISFPISGLTTETTVVALEFYLYKGEWKISAVGAGYSSGMAKLCNSYGLEVV